MKCDNHITEHSSFIIHSLIAIETLEISNTYITSMTLPLLQLRYHKNSLILQIHPSLILLINNSPITPKNKDSKVASVRSSLFLPPSLTGAAIPLLLLHTYIYAYYLLPFLYIWRSSRNLCFLCLARSRTQCAHSLSLS